ncbi:MAG: DNA recombination protein RmuC [bacterium]|nr:DNA recombination protein RmuC [bacterium]
MNQTLFILIGVAVIVVGANILFYYLALRKKDGGTADAPLDLMLQQMNENSRTIDARMSELARVMDTKMGETTRTMNESVRLQFTESQKLIKDITRELTEVRETGKRVENFADQLQSLQDILKNPKQRGILGEYYLETLLKNVLPVGSYQMQYEFKDGTIVDAVVFVKEKIIPIDSKFSLENYNRLVEEKDPVEKERLEKTFKADLKNRIDETSKYVKPAEGTMDFAFMFIPHEAIYYDLLVSQVGAVKINTRDLIEYAFKDKHVIIVSPTSFLAYLQTVLQGLKMLHIEEQATQIIKNVEDLGKHLKSYEEYHNKLGGALSTTINHFNASNKEFKKIDKDMLRIAGESIGIEALALDRPDDPESY